MRGFNALVVIGTLVTCAPASADVESAEGEQAWWSFHPPDRPAIPDIHESDWPRNPIDFFVLAKLLDQDVLPSPTADKVTLIRRLSLDLTGLPPSPREVDAFLADTDPGAYECLVDRLLGSPHYGERWGRHWLDLARYSDSAGGEIDAPRPMWRYRDWVIDALNRNLPFDQFVIWQLAGDLLPRATREQIIATGFYRCGVYDRLAGNGSDEVARLTTVVDRVNTTGAAFLGLTLGCAQCHSHKFDPISIREYYQLFAFFNDVDDCILGFPTQRDLERYKTIRAQIATLEEELADYDKDVKGRARRWELNLTDDERRQFAPEVQAALSIGVEIRGNEQIELVYRAFRQQDVSYQQRQSLINQLDQVAPEVDLTPVMHPRTTPRATHVYLRGDFHSAGDEVSPGVPKVLPSLPEKTTLKEPGDQSAQRRASRLDLARWLVDPNHPLTARVTVNRIWQRYFGQGLVLTENDFGTQGSPPTHPSLLDWLACEFIDSGWDLKVLHRLIVTSATYRQSSQPREELAHRDPRNALLARQARLRLEAEVICDVSLAAAGLLSSKIGGPSVYPHQPDGVLEGRATLVEWKESAGEDRFRRGMYTHHWRLTPHPFYRTFDAPEALASCTRRYRSNTPLQALTLLNDRTFVEAADGLALRLLKNAPASDAERIAYAFRVCVTRHPTPEETKLLGQMLDARRREYHEDPELAEQFLTLDPPAKSNHVDVTERAAWTAVCRAVLNLDELITRD